MNIDCHTISPLRSLVLLSIMTVASTGLRAQSPPEGFVSLLSADSLDGWVGGVEDWRVESGTLIGRTDGKLKANRFIVADIDPVRNFELQVEVWVSPGGNSGLQYRSQQRPDLGPFVVTGYQCDVVSNRAEYNGMLYEERGRRILAHTGEQVVIDTDAQPWVVGKMPVQTFEAGEWHRFRVLVEGNRHRHWIDDVPTVDVIDLDVNGRSLEGVIGVQVHVGPAMEIKYRNFFLKRLPDELPLLTSSDAPANIPADAVKVVPQGGWKRAGRRDANAKLTAASLGKTRAVHQAGNVLLAGQPDPGDFTSLADDGFGTVISLRTDGEIDWDESEVVRDAGLKFVQLPFRNPDDLTDEVFDRCRELLRNASPKQQVCLHCASANRVGAVWLVHRVLDGRMAIEQAIEEAQQVGLKTEAYKQKALDYLKRNGRH